MGTNILDKQSIENVPVPYNGTHESADQLSEKVQENVYISAQIETVQK